MDVGFCFNDISIGHNHEDDDFVRTWYDVFDATEEEYVFKYQASSNNHPIYFAVETWMLEMVPAACGEPSVWYSVMEE